MTTTTTTGETCLFIARHIWRRRRPRFEDAGASAGTHLDTLPLSLFLRPPVPPTAPHVGDRGE